MANVRPATACSNSSAADALLGREGSRAATFPRGLHGLSAVLRAQVCARESRV